MRSIQRRLTLSLTLVGCLLWSVGGAALYLAMRAGLISEFDQALATSAQTLAALASQDNGVLEFDFDPALLPAFASGEKPDYFQLWLPDGSTWQRSPSLDQADLPRPTAGIADVTLPGGLVGRAILHRFVVTQTYDEVAEPPATPHPRVSIELVVARQRADLDRRLHLLALTLLLVGASSALATALLVPLLVGRGLRPLRSLAARTAGIDAADLAVRFPAAGMPAELLPICERLNELLARLEASFERERRFSADVAHELRTPIAELRSLAEVALRWPDDRAANARALQDALEIALRLQAISAGLLNLARCDAGQQRFTRETVRVSELVEAVWRPLADTAREKGLATSFELPADAQCLADPAGLRLVLTNLLANAVQYSPRGGTLVCRATSGGGRFLISVANSAPELEPADLPQLFERFWRKDAARTADAHAGLGLALAKAYAEAMGISLAAELQPDGLLLLSLDAPGAEAPPRPARRKAAAGALVLALASAAVASAGEPQDPQPVALVVAAGRPLRVALDARVRVKRVGQSVTATLVEDVYAHDRVVVPAGAKLTGRIVALERTPRGERLRGALLRGDLSPARRVVLEFDRLCSGDRVLNVATRVGPGTAEMVLQAADEPPGPGLAGRARVGARRELQRAVVAVKRPGKPRRLLRALAASLPFHAQYLPEGAVYDAQLLEPLEFGVAAPTPRAPADAPLPADGILSARLLTALDSAATPRGTPIEAVLTRPLFSSEAQLMLPEGTRLRGEVTFSKRASHFRRNGQLRLLFDAARAPERAERGLRASLQAAEVGRGTRLAIDDEGGASVTNSKARFVAPVLAAGAASASLARESVYDPGEPGFATGALEASGTGTALGGFSALGVLGIGLSQLSRPAGVALGFAGLARSLYGSVAGRGKEVCFPAGTRIEVRLAAAQEPAN